MSVQDEERVVVKRYARKRLYRFDQHRYVTLEELRSWAAEGKSVAVIDFETGEDVAHILLA